MWDSRYEKPSGVAIWDVATGRQVGGILVSGQMVSDVRFTPDGQRLIIIIVGRGASILDITGLETQSAVRRQR